MKITIKNSLIYFINNLFVLATNENSSLSNKNYDVIVNDRETKTVTFKSTECYKITIRDIIALSSNVETVIFDTTCLQKIPEDLFEKLCNVKTIIFIRNPFLQKLPFSFYKLRSVKVLKIIDTFVLNELPIIWKNLEELTLENVLCRNVISISKSVQDFKNLRILDISRNTLIQLPQAVLNLDQIEVLNLSNNSFKTIPTELLRMTNLKNLNVSSNSLKSFKNIGKELFMKLETLNVSDNDFTWDVTTVMRNLAKSLFNSTVDTSKYENESIYKLKHFVISNNFSSLSPLVFKGYAQFFYNLRTLTIEDSGVEKLPKFVYDLKKLILIDIRKNNNFKELNKLQSMNLPQLLN